MIKGIGIDMVSIPDVKAYMWRPEYVTHTFTKKEQQEAEKRPDHAEYLASRFAAKEAVFKAVAGLTEKKGFDLRIIETLNRADGAPYVCVGNKLQKYLDEAGISALYISVTTEKEYAAAFVVAEG